MKSLWGWIYYTLGRCNKSVKFLLRNAEIIRGLKFTNEVFVFSKMWNKNTRAYTVAGCAQCMLRQWQAVVISSHLWNGDGAGILAYLYQTLMEEVTLKFCFVNVAFIPAFSLPHLPSMHVHIQYTQSVSFNCWAFSAIIIYKM